MNLQEILTACGITQCPRCFRENFAAAAEICAVNRDFASFRQVERNCGEFGLLAPGSENYEDVMRAAQAICARPQTRLLAALWCNTAFFRRNYGGCPPGSWQPPFGRQPDKKLESEMFPAIVYIIGFPLLHAAWVKRGVPEDILAASRAEFACCLDVYRRRFGRPGMGMFYFNWIMIQVEERLYHIGRLNFESQRLEFPVSLFYNAAAETAAKAADKFAVLYNQPVSVARNGLPAGMPGAQGAEFRTAFAETGDYFEGNAVGPDGRILPRPTRLSKTAWQLQATTGDPVIGIHIPGGGALAPEEAKNACRRAAALFPRIFPGETYKAFVCYSWLLDPQLRTLLKPGSRILAFQDLFLPFAAPSDATSIFTFVFLKPFADYASLPETTSLERALKSHLLGGGHIYDTGGFIPLKNISDGGLDL